MADKPRNKNGANQPGKPSYQIWIILGLMTFFIAISYFSNSNSAIEISFKRFEQMVLSDDVQKVTLIGNQNIVEVTLRAEALQNSKYRTQLENQNTFGLSSGKGPQFYFKIESKDIFVKKKDELNAKLREGPF